MEDKLRERISEGEPRAGARPSVSVVIPAYNYGRFLGHTIESMLSQSYAPLQVVVVNDGSTDETAEVIRRYQADPRVKGHTQANQGTMIAMNNGIALSQGAYLAFCGSDDLWNPEHVRRLMEEFDRHPGAGLVFDNAEYFRDQTGERCGQVVPEKKSKELSGRQVSVQEIFLHNWITNCTFLVRREVFNRVGLFEPKNDLLGDLHLIYRIAARYTVYFVDYTGVRLRVHGRNMSTLCPHYENGVRNLEDIRQNYPEVYGKIGAAIFARKLGRKYFRLACYYEKTGETAKALATYKKAFLTRRSRPQYYWKYLRLSCSAALGREEKCADHGAGDDPNTLSS